MLMQLAVVPQRPHMICFSLSILAEIGMIATMTLEFCSEIVTRIKPLTGEQRIECIELHLCTALALSTLASCHVIRKFDDQRPL